MRRKRPQEVQCPVELVRFDPAEWPAATAFHAWQSWLHARADFEEDAGLDFDTIPYEVGGETWRLVEDSLGQGPPSPARGGSTTPIHGAD